MAKYTASLAAQSTNTYLFTVHKPDNGADCCTFTVLLSGTFGTGTVNIYISPDAGTTLCPLAPINGDSPDVTAIGAYTFKVGNADKLGEEPQIFVGVGAATSPDIDIVAYDNR